MRTLSSCSCSGSSTRCGTVPSVTFWLDTPGAATGTRVERAAVTIGTFDGVHRGHQHVLARTREAGGGLPVVVVTFEPMPRAVVDPAGAARALTDLDRRVELLHAHGADEVRVLHFTPSLAAWSPEEFIDRVLVDSLRTAALVVGENFHFGSRASGDVAMLQELGRTRDFVTQGLVLEGTGQVEDELPFSSTLVRSLVAQARLAEAAEVLGRPHEVSGTVVQGDRRGRELGFPTANVPVDESFIVPPDGVYAGRLVIDGDSLPAAVSIGTNPTFDGVERRVESYVMDHGHDLDLYGRHVRVELVERLRGMEAYDTVDALVAQMHDDVTAAREVLAGGPA